MAILEVSRPCGFQTLTKVQLTRSAPQLHSSRVAGVRCSQETQRFFYKRLEQHGWDREKTRGPNLHPLVVETWKSMDHIYGLGVIETPLHPSPWLHSFGGEDATVPGSVHLKLESTQVTGSFKARGAAHKLLSRTPEQLKSGVVTSSTGNHALATLHAATALGAAGHPVNLTVYIPSTVSPKKLSKLQAAAAKCSAELVTVGEDCVEAEGAARKAAESSGKTYVSPYNDLAVAGGQGTLAVEILMSLPREKLDAVFVPVGGGGLISGVAALLKSLDPGIKVFGCQPELSDVMRRSVEAGKVVELPWEESLSDATAGGIEEGSLTVEACTQFVDECITVTEPEIAAAMVGVHGHHGVAVEGAAGVAVASYIKLAEQMHGKHAVVIICGGNVSAETLDKAYELAASSMKRSRSMASM